MLVNALAILAYTYDDKVFENWKREIDFDALNNWLVEQQNELHQYENAIVSFKSSKYFFINKQLLLGYLFWMSSHLQLPSDSLVSNQLRFFHNSREHQFGELRVIPLATLRRTGSSIYAQREFETFSVILFLNCRF